MNRFIALLVPTPSTVSPSRPTTIINTTERAASVCQCVIREYRCTVCHALDKAEIVIHHGRNHSGACNWETSYYHMQVSPRMCDVCIDRRERERAGIDDDWIVIEQEPKGSNSSSGEENGSDETWLLVRSDELSSSEGKKEV